jgi:hypothetical protein
MDFKSPPSWTELEVANLYKYILLDESHETNWQRKKLANRKLLGKCKRYDTLQAAPGAATQCSASTVGYSPTFIVSFFFDNTIYSPCSLDGF